MQAPKGRRTLRLLTAIASLTMILAAASGAHAAVLTPWGPNLQDSTLIPTMDSANGASSETNDEPAGMYYGDNSDQAVITAHSPGCTHTYGASTVSCTAFIHTGADNTVWNTSMADTAPQGGQILDINVKGCADKDRAAPTNPDGSQTYEGIPSNMINFETLAKQSDGSYKGDQVAPYFLLPFCGDTVGGQTTTSSTITTYHPIHLCVQPGETVALYSIGGFIPSQSGPSYYPQGMPMQTIAPGDGMDSFTDADAINLGGDGVYRPGSQPRGENSGWGSEPAEQVLIQAVEGVGDDAYGLCPGGNAREPVDSNTVICVARQTSPGDPYGTCNSQGQPVFPPQNASAPTISVTNNSKPITGAPVPGDRIDVTHGTWTNSPYGYHEQWADCDPTGANCTPIAGATNPYYYITKSDIGHTIEAQEYGINQANTEGPASSAATQMVSAPRVPVISNMKLNPSTWNEASSSVITWTDTEFATTTFNVVQGTTIIKTLRNVDRSSQYGGNGIPLSGIPAGSYQLQATPNNQGTLGQTVTLPFTVTSATPVITHLKLNPPLIHGTRGTTATYIDSVAAHTTLTITTTGPGILRGHTCVKMPKRVPAHAKRCKAQIVVLKALNADRAGPNGVKLKVASPGHYLLTVTASFAHRKSVPVTAAIVVRR